MSYRTYVNDHQIFGDNEYYPEWLEFIKSSRIEISEDDNYSGEITDFMSALETTEKIVLRLTKTRKMKNIFDLSDIPKELERESKEIGHNPYLTSLFDRLSDVIQYGYAFIPYALYAACADKLDKIEPFLINNHCNCFELKDGETIHVEAY